MAIKLTVINTLPTSFRNAFTQSIHEHSSLSIKQKHMYIVHCRQNVSGKQTFFHNKMPNFCDWKNFNEAMAQIFKAIAGLWMEPYFICEWILRISY